MIGKEVVRGLKKNKLRLEEEKMAFKEKMRISHKVLGSAKIFTFLWFSKIESMPFWKIVIKAISH